MNASPNTDHPGTSWMKKASCARTPHLGWLRDPERVGYAEEAAMATVCARCPVLAACEAYVQAEEITGGFWAGHHQTPDGPLLPLVPAVPTRGDAA